MKKKQLQVLSDSQLNTYRKCPQKWAFRYVDRLEPRHTGRAFIIGRWVHDAIAAGLLAYWRGDIPDNVYGPHEAAMKAATVSINLTSPEGAKLFGTDEEMFESVNLCHAVVGHYFRGYGTTDKLVPVAIEREFDVPVADNAGRNHMLRHTGRIDLVELDLVHNVLVVDDHKTTAQGFTAQLERKLELGTQLVGYAYAVDWYLRNDPSWFDSIGGVLPGPDTTVSRIAYNLIRKKIPAVPEKLKKTGLITARKNLDTLPEVYAAALATQGALPTQEQTALLGRLTEQMGRWYTRVDMVLRPEMVERWRQEFWVEAKRIRAAGRNRSLWTRNPLACTDGSVYSCEYGDVCINDTPEVREAFYQSRDHDHQETNPASGGRENPDPQEASKSGLGW